MKKIVFITLIAIVLTLISSACSRIEIDARAFGYPDPWLVRFSTSEASHVELKSYYVRWNSLVTNILIYFLIGTISLAGARLVRMLRPVRATGL